MGDFLVRKLLGGPGNGQAVPGDWQDGIQDWIDYDATERHQYGKRVFFHGQDKFTVWVSPLVEQGQFYAIMYWHREMYRGDLVDAQKSLMHETMKSSMNYANVIMLAGYAALFTLWSQSRTDLTPATSLAAGIFLAVSVLSFVGFEVFGMMQRAKFMMSIGKAVSDPDRFEERMRAVQDDQQNLLRRLAPIWKFALTVAVTFALAAFVILLAAMMHGAWLSFLKDSLARVS